MAGVLGSERRILPRSCAPRTLEVPAFLHLGETVPVQGFTLRSVARPFGFHTCSANLGGVVEDERGQAPRVPGRPARGWADFLSPSARPRDCDSYLCAGRFHNKSQKVRSLPVARPCLHRGETTYGLGPRLPASGTAGSVDEGGQVVRACRDVPYCPCVDAGTRTDGGYHINSPRCTPSHASRPAVSESTLAFPVAGGQADDHSQALSVPTVVAGGGESVTGFALPTSPTHHSDYDGRVHGGLGRSPDYRRSKSPVQWTMEQSRAQGLSYQPPGTASNQADIVPGCASDTRSGSADRMRQHNGSQLPEQTGRHKVKHSLCRGLRDPRVVNSPQSDRHGSPQTRCRQSSGGLPVSQSPRPSGVVSGEYLVPAAVGQMGCAADRSVRLSVQSQAPCVVQSITLPVGGRNRRTHAELEGAEGVCFSPIQSDSADSEEALRGQSRVGDSDHPILAQEDLVSVGNVHGNRTALDPASGIQPPVSVPAGQGDLVPPRPTIATVGSLEAEKLAWRRQGFSDDVIDTALAAKRGSTRTVYDSRWQAFVDWCTQRHIDPLSCNVPQFLEFLQQLVHRNLALNTIKGYVTAVSSRRGLVEYRDESVRMAAVSPVRTWLRGLSIQRPPVRSRVPPWSLELVLRVLTSAPFYPLHQCDLKHLTLRTVFLLAISSARRASELHAIRVDSLVRHGTGYIAYTDERFLPKIATEWHVNLPIHLPAIPDDADAELRKLCVATCIDAYVSATKPLRETTSATQLLVCYGKTKQGQPVSKQRVSTWLKEVVTVCYQLQGQPLPHVKGHDTRKMATSWAHVAGVEPRTICEAAMWQSSNMFARFYKLDLLHADHGELGRRVLHLATPATT